VSALESLLNWTSTGAVGGATAAKKRFAFKSKLSASSKIVKPTGSSTSSSSTPPPPEPKQLRDDETSTLNKEKEKEKEKVDRKTKELDHIVESRRLERVQLSSLFDRTSSVPFDKGYVRPSLTLRQSDSCVIVGGSGRRGRENQGLGLQGNDKEKEKEDEQEKEKEVEKEEVYANAHFSKLRNCLVDSVTVSGSLLVEDCENVVFLRLRVGQVWIDCVFDS
jgi:hypothetical protein